MWWWAHRRRTSQRILILQFIGMKLSIKWFCAPCVCFFFYKVWRSVFVSLSLKVKYRAEKRPVWSITPSHHPFYTANVASSANLLPFTKRLTYCVLHLSLAELQVLFRDIHGRYSPSLLCNCSKRSQPGFISTTSNMHRPSDVLSRDPGPSCSREAQQSPSLLLVDLLLDLVPSVLHCSIKTLETNSVAGDSQLACYFVPIVEGATTRQRCDFSSRYWLLALLLLFIFLNCQGPAGT